MKRNLAKCLGWITRTREMMHNNFRLNRLGCNTINTTFLNKKNTMVSFKMYHCILSYTTTSILLKWQWKTLTYIQGLIVRSMCLIVIKLQSHLHITFIQLKLNPICRWILTVSFFISFSLLCYWVSYIILKLWIFT